MGEGDGLIGKGAKGGIVRGDEDGAAFFVGEALEGGGNGFAGGGVETGGGFVGEDDGGVADQGAGDGDALLLAARELAGAGAFGGYVELTQ